MNKVIRTICLFRKNPTHLDVKLLQRLKHKVEEHGFSVQTLRLCSPTTHFMELEQRVNDSDIFLSAGQLHYGDAYSNLDDFYQSNNVSFNVDITAETLTVYHTQILFNLIRHNPSKTFKFSYTFNNVTSSPYFPSASYERDGFSFGLQPTNLSEEAKSLDDWLMTLHTVWEELHLLFCDEKEYLGIDSSVAPLFEGSSSLIHFIKQLGMTFSESVVTDTYLRITQFIKDYNPRPTGLNGLMLPALEDFELADEYQKGNFSIERNIFLSLHSGLGVDTYPIGVNENPEKVLRVLQLVQGLSNKYTKPLSTRFISDGQAKIGEKTDFKNEYLKNVVIRTL